MDLVVELHGVVLVIFKKNSKFIIVIAALTSIPLVSASEYLEASDYQAYLDKLDFSDIRKTDDFTFIPYMMSHQSGLGWINKFDYQVFKRNMGRSARYGYASIKLKADPKAVQAYRAFIEQNNLHDQGYERVILPEGQTICALGDELQGLVDKYKSSRYPIRITSTHASLTQLCEVNIRYRRGHQAEVFNILDHSDNLLNTHIQLTFTVANAKDPVDEIDSKHIVTHTINSLEQQGVIEKKSNFWGKRIGWVGNKLEVEFYSALIFGNASIRSIASEDESQHSSSNLNFKLWRDWFTNLTVDNNQITIPLDEVVANEEDMSSSVTSSEDEIFYEIKI